MLKRPIIGLAIAATLVVAQLAVSAARVAAQSPPCEIDRVERVVAVGDVHGAYDRFVEILKAVKLLDERLRWTGGRTHLVQLGDVVDRGPDSRKTLDLLERLQEEAQRAGGAVHVLLGNHEAMRMLGDLRYVVPGEYRAFTTAKSDEIRRNFLDGLAPPLRKQFEDAPAGFVEMLAAFRPDGEYGRWLRRLNTVIKINGVLFVHGGIGPATSAMSCGAINEAVRRELTEDLDKTRDAPLQSLSAGENGPLWYRGLTQDADAVAPDVDGVLKEQRVRAMVIGHTLAPDRRIQVRFGGKVFQIDTGMQPAYVPAGRASALEIQGDVFTAVYLDRRDVLLRSNR